MGKEQGVFLSPDLPYSTEDKMKMLVGTRGKQGAGWGAAAEDEDWMGQ